MPGGIRVCNKRKGAAAKPLPGEVVVDIDRSNPVLGNQHVLKDHRDDQQRASVIVAFEKDLAADCARGGPMSKAIEEITGRVIAGDHIALNCWCEPKPCHGHAIVRKVQERVAIAVGDAGISDTAEAAGEKDQRQAASGL